MYKLIEIDHLHNLVGFSLKDLKLNCSNELISKFGGDHHQFEIFDEETAIKETSSIIELNNNETDDFFLGEALKGYSPGKIDLNYILLIGQTEYSEPFALYFHENILEPEVIHYVIKEETDVWVRIFSSYKEMLQYI